MPSFNHERYIHAAIQSVLNQTYSNFELLVIDDASSDASWRIIDSIRDPRISTRRHDTNLGADATLNEAIAWASGELLAIINSDDIYDSKRLERILLNLPQSCNPPVLIFTDVDFVDELDRGVPEHPRATNYRDLRDRCRSLPPEAWFLTANPAITTSNFAFSRALIDQIGGFAALRYTHDWDFVLRAQRNGEVIWVRERLLHYRVHSANTLSEADQWRHIHENSYIQLNALELLSNVSTGIGNEPRNTLVKALLTNDSLHPVSLLSYLVLRYLGTPAPDLLTATRGVGGEWMLATIAKQTSIPNGIFRSVSHLIQQDAEIQSQVEMLAERLAVIQHMSTEIRDRDQWISEQAATIGQKEAFIKELETCIAGQTALIDQRWAVIKHMENEISNRDKHIGDLSADLNELRSHWLFRAQRLITRSLSRFRSRKLR